MGLAGGGSVWSDPSWLDEPSPETPWLAPERYATVATRTELQVPIESVPIGARVPTKNPNRWEVDSQPEPDQATWAKLSITVERSDGGIVDAEIIRPRSWILRNGMSAGRMLPLNLPELEVSGLAFVTAIVLRDRPCVVGRGNASIFFSGVRAKSRMIPPREGFFRGIETNPGLFFTDSAQTDSLKLLTALPNLHHHRTIDPATASTNPVTSPRTYCGLILLRSLLGDSLEDLTSIEASGRR